MILKSCIGCKFAKPEVSNMLRSYWTCLVSYKENAMGSNTEECECKEEEKDD